MLPVLSALALAAAGPVGSAVGVTHLLTFSAIWQVTSVALMLLVPSIRQIRSVPEPADELIADPAPASSPAGPHPSADPHASRTA